MQRTILTAFTLIAFPSLHAQGDLCSGAWLIGPGVHASDGPSSGGGATMADATNADWFSFDPVTAGYITVQSCLDGAADTRVHIHTGSCGTLTTLGSDDDGCPQGYPPGNSLLANVPVTPGNLYFIEWDDRWDDGAFTWELIFHTCPAPVPPAIISTDSSITVEWNAVSAGATFSIELGPPGFTPGAGILITGTEGTDGPPVTFTGLAEATLYDLYLWIDCGGDPSPNIGPWPVATAGNPFVPNDDCEDAQPIACGESFTDSTLLALDDAVADCGTGISAPGVWYTFTGTGEPVVLTMCNAADYDSKLNIYTGACGSLVCVDGNDDATSCGLTSELTVPTVLGDEYFALVQGYNGATGVFTLSMDCPTCPAPQAPFINVLDVSAFVHWTSYNPGATFMIEHGPPGFTPGTGILVTGTVGVDGPPAQVTGLDPATDYDLYITEDCGGGDVSATAGPFEFTTLTDPPPSNTFCDSPQPIGCGDILIGETTLAILTAAPTCGAVNVSAPGLWYTFTGAGQDVILSTCGSADFDTKLSVYAGPCTALQCVAANDDGLGACGTTSILTFFAEAGVEYLVLVHGYSQDTGAFTLSMTCMPQCTPLLPNDDCTGAIVLVPQPIGSCIPTDATNVCAYAPLLPNPGCDPYGNIMDAWFTFNTGANADHTIFIQEVTAGALLAAVYADCPGTTPILCLDAIAGPIDLTGLTPGTDHFIRVWNHGYGEAGTFTICVGSDIPSAVVEDGSGAIVLRPIPALDGLWIDGLPPEAQEVVIRDAQGRVMIRHRAAPWIDVSALSAGSYVLEVRGDRTPLLRPFLKW